jgi:hypothetical protein
MAPTVLWAGFTGDWSPMHVFIVEDRQVSVGRGNQVMDGLCRNGEPRPESPHINKDIVLESYKAACLVVDWAKAVTAVPDGGGRTQLDSELDKWSFLEYVSRPDVVDYEQIDDPVRLLSVMAGLELVLLLSADKEEAFSTRREWQKLGRWMNERYGLDANAFALTSIDLTWPEGSMPIAKALMFIFEHMPELKSGWNEGGADALNDYLYVLWLEAREK